MRSCTRVRETTFGALHESLRIEPASGGSLTEPNRSRLASEKSQGTDFEARLGNEHTRRVHA